MTNAQSDMTESNEQKLAYESFLETTHPGDRSPYRSFVSGRESLRRELQLDATEEGCVYGIKKNAQLFNYRDPELIHINALLSIIDRLTSQPAGSEGV